jgi:hypothetical protein
MSKRFIDTDLFDDSWFMDLSLSGKILWIYCITKCDHAGIIELNEKLCSFQTGIKSLPSVIEELSNRLHTVKDGVYFIPKFINFQYPGFPKSNVKQQQGAINILKSHGLYDKENGVLIKDLPNSYKTVNKELSNSYGNDNGNDNNIKESFEIFWEHYHTITQSPKTDKEPALKHWKKLTLTERREAYKQVQKYYDSIRDKKYVKKARTYLSDKNFNDELTPAGGSSVYKADNVWEEKF